MGHYLKRTKEKGIMLCVNKNNDFEHWADVDFVGGWNLKESSRVKSALSRLGFIIKGVN